MTDITPGSLVARKDDTSTQTLVTYITGGNAQCQWYDAQGELHVDMIPVEDLVVYVPETQRARFHEDRALADQEIAQLELNRANAQARAASAALAASEETEA